MRKIISVILVILVMTSTLMVHASEPSEDLFTVNFLPATKSFSVSATDVLKGTNRVLLVVKNDNDKVVYMDAFNEAKAEDVTLFVNLGNSLKNGEYTFILSSDGDTKSSQLKTCRAAFEEEANFFDVSYDADKNAFVVTGEITKENGDASVNRILLMAYEPRFNGQSDICYMNALNEHKGQFTFEVPLNNASPVGDYIFVVSSDGDVVTNGSKTCEYTDNFETFGALEQGTTIGGTYTLKAGQTAATVIIAIYKTDAHGNTSFVTSDISSTVVEGKVTAQITLPDAEDITSYSAKAFVWESVSTLVPLSESRLID